MYSRPVCYALGGEIVTLWEDEFLAGFKPLNKATRQMCKISGVQDKVKWTLLILEISKATSKLFSSQGCPDDKNCLYFSSFFFKICRVSQFNFAFAVSFHSTRGDARVRFDSGAIFLDQSKFFSYVQ